MLLFLPADDDDLGELVRTSRLAFDNDLHCAAPASAGPDGYDSIAWHRRATIWGGRVYKIVKGGAIVGGIVVQPDPRHNPRSWYLSRIWLVPEWQNQGLGGKALAFIESTAPAARVWHLETPAYSLRNRHFYEKHGYRQVGTRRGMTLYDKRMPS